MARKTFTIGSIEGAGHSATAAREAAIKLASDALARMDEAPRFVRIRDHAIFVFARIDSWYYQIVRPDTGVRSPDAGCSRFYGHGGFATPEEAERRGRVHVAQNLYQPGEDITDEVIIDARDRSDHRSWLGFQEAYRALRASGMSDTEAHAAACVSSSRSQAVSL